MATEILRALGPGCRDPKRRDLLRRSLGLGLNGIDFVEYRHNPTPPEHVLEVHFLLSPAPAGLTASDIHIQGGVRIAGIRATHVDRDGHVLLVTVNGQGDFSTYTLAIAWSRQPDGTWRFDPTRGIDRQFSVAPINFRAGCPVDFDCAPVEVCPPESLEEPVLDYLAKDYASFRQLLLDLVAQRNPDWIERNPADLGIALLELFAHEGDHLSYFQDAVANEAYLDTARKRVSAKRHARLVDYPMHDGRNAWTFVHMAVSEDGTLPLGQTLLTRVMAPLRRQDTAPGTVIRPPADGLDFDTDPPLVRARIFETATELRASTLNNEIRVHTWGNEECCLPRGAVTAHLFSVDATGAAVLPDIREGDYVLFEEVLGPESGVAADADPHHRQVVQIVSAREIADPVFDATLVSGELQARSTAGTALPLLEVTWRQADTLTFPLCLSAKRPDGSAIRRVSVARANIVVADHGRGVTDEFVFDETPPSDRPFRLKLRRAPLTMQCEPEDVRHDPATARMTTPRPDLTCPVRQARPAVALRATDPAGGVELWTPVTDLLASSAFNSHFVVDVEDDGRATVRFGDGEYGRALTGVATVHAAYRVGNGRAGNIGADALAHVVLPAVTPAGWPEIELVRNPLAARDGADPETIEEVRQFAPVAFRAQQLRAVTPADYRDAGLTLEGVAGAVAAFRWTGSWYTVYVGIDPKRPDDLVTESGGRTRFAPEFERALRAGLTRYKLAGYDLEFRTAQYVALRIEIELCVAPDHFRGDVAQAVIEALGPGVDPRGRRGLFHPDNWTFGQSVYLSRVYATVKAVEGVQSAVVTVFHRFGRDPAGELDAAVIPIGSWEIARLDNDPNRMENGVLIVTAGGGK